MKAMRWVWSLAVLLTLGTAPAFGQLTVGVDANYSTGSESIGGGGEIQYQLKLTPLLYLVPSAQYRAHENETSTFFAGVDLRAMLKPIDGFSPYLGGGYAYRRRALELNPFTDTAFDHRGLNLHAGLSYTASDNVFPFVQLRYYVGDAFDNDRVDFQAGVRMHFSN